MLAEHPHLAASGQGFAGRGMLRRLGMHDRALGNHDRDLPALGGHPINRAAVARGGQHSEDRKPERRAAPFPPRERGRREHEKPRRPDRDRHGRPVRKPHQRLLPPRLIEQARTGFFPCEPEVCDRIRLPRLKHQRAFVAQRRGAEFAEPEARVAEIVERVRVELVRERALIRAQSRREIALRIRAVRDCKIPVRTGKHARAKQSRNEQPERCDARCASHRPCNNSGDCEFARPKIARHFSAGIAGKMKKVPEGRKKIHPPSGSAVPPGLIALLHL